MKSSLEEWLLIILILLIIKPELLWCKKSRHNRETNKNNKDMNKKNNNKNGPEEIFREKCVSGFCLPAAYKQLDLPSSERQHIKMNLEVNFFLGVK